jgi:hypothetical protein
MCPWLILASVRKVEILRHEKSAVGLSRTPHDRTLLITQAQGMSATRDAPEKVLHLCEDGGGWNGTRWWVVTTRRDGTREAR